MWVRDLDVGRHFAMSGDRRTPDPKNPELAFNLSVLLIIPHIQHVNHAPLKK